VALVDTSTGETVTHMGADVPFSVEAASGIEPL
jgi:hypothetical protein